MMVRGVTEQAGRQRGIHKNNTLSPELPTKGVHKGEYPYKELLLYGVSKDRTNELKRALTATRAIDDAETDCDALEVKKQLTHRMRTN